MSENEQDIGATPEYLRIGLRPGIVVDDKDPETSGHLRVRVSAFYGHPDEDEIIEDDELPWAKPCFPACGDGLGIMAVPSIGAEVWVGLEGGDLEAPVWMGGMFPTSQVPAEFSGAYNDGPKAYIIKTPNGHIFQMRYVPNEEKVEIVTAGNQSLILDDVLKKVDAQTEGGYRLLLDENAMRSQVVTPTREVVLDDAAQQARLADASQSVVLDGAAQTISATTPGNVNVNAGALVTILGTLLLTITGLAAVTISAAAVLTLVGASISMTGAVTIVTSLAVGTATKKVIVEPIVAAINDHKHVAPAGGGITTVPTTLIASGAPAPYNLDDMVTTKVLVE